MLSNENYIIYRKMLENPNISYSEVKKYVGQYMPQKLYRYRTFDQYYKSNIMDGQVYLACPNTYNDPFDSAVKFDYKRCVEVLLGKNSANLFPEILSSDPKLRILFENHYRDTFDGFKEYVKMACFSEKKDSILMWSHYAENHSGFCIEYDTQKNSLFNELALPVIYMEERYDATECLLTQSKNIAFNPIIYKDISWSYENEWRLWGSKDYFENKPNYLEMKNAISAIYIGACIKDKDKNKIEEIKQWACHNHVKIYKMVLDEATYRLIPKDY